MSESLRGHFLIAGKNLRDPNFYKSVVLIIEHEAEGTMGLVANRPSTINVADALSDHFELPPTDDLVYGGGPVEPSALFILHDHHHFNDSEPAIIPEVYVGNNPQVFEKIMQLVIDGDQPIQFRIYCGCSGWGKGQLEDEISRGDWFVLPATEELLFHKNPQTLWDTLRNKIHRSPSLIPDGPQNPEWN